VALRCLIVDDSQSYLEAAAALLKREGASVLGVTSTSEDALLQARRLVPDVVLVDIILRGESGLDLARRLAELEPPRPAVILISAHSESDFAELIGETPVAGFLPKADLSTRAIQKLVDGV
jgi:DNA-binding NarL/FixJ family response regulator